MVVESRFRLVNDTLSVKISFVDRDDICRYHNRAFQLWCGRGNDLIDGIPLHAVVDGAIYRDIKSHSIEVQNGREVHFNADWRSRENSAVTLLPYPPAILPISGFYVIIE